MFVIQFRRPAQLAGPPDGRLIDGPVPFAQRLGQIAGQMAIGCPGLRHLVIEFLDAVMAPPRAGLPFRQEIEYPGVADDGGEQVDR